MLLVEPTGLHNLFPVRRQFAGCVFGAGHEDDRTHIHNDAVNALRIVGENLADAAVKISYMDHDGDMNIDVPADKIATETDGISINGEWLAEILPAYYACDMTFTLTTDSGNATFTLRYE